MPEQRWRLSWAIRSTERERAEREPGLNCGWRRAMRTVVSTSLLCRLSWFACLGLVACVPTDPVAPPPAVEFRCATDNGAAIIGLEELTLCGSVVVGGQTAVDIFSNELVHLSGSAELAGDAVIAEGGTFERSGNAISMQGEVRTGADPIVVEPETAAAAAAAANNNNDQLKIGNKSAIKSGALTLSGQTSLSVPGGDYHFTGISISGKATIELQGDARFYVDGKIKFTGTTTTANGGSYTLEVISVSSQTVTFAGNSTAKLHVSAPLAKVKMAGTSDFTGTVLGRVVTITGNADVQSGGDASNYGGVCGEDPGGSSGGGDVGGGDDGSGDDLPPADGGPHIPDDDGAPPDDNAD